MKYLQSFHFTIKHKSGKLNQGVDVLSQRYLLLFQLDASILGFKHIKGLYNEDEDFGELYSSCQKHPKVDYLIQEGYLFKGTRLCIPKHSTRELLIHKIHRGSLARHYNENETHIMLRGHCYQLSMEKDVQDILRRYGTCQAAKSHSFPHGLYMP